MKGVGQRRLEDVKKEVKRLTDAEQLQQGPPRLEGRGFPKVKEAVGTNEKSESSDEELNEEVAPEGGGVLGSRTLAHGVIYNYISGNKCTGFSCYDLLMT